MIPVKTELGQRVLKDRSIPLTVRQRSMFILMDGKRSAAEILALAGSTGFTQGDMDQLIELGLIQDAQPQVTANAAASALKIKQSQESFSQRTPQQRYLDAYPIAIRLTAELGLRGFFLNMSVEGAGNYEDLVQLAPKIKEAVGSQKFAPLEQALWG